MALTPEEDADLRRLAVFDSIGFLTDEGRARMQELRARDRRAAIRAPQDVDPIADLPHLGALPRLASCSVYPDEPRLVLSIPSQRCAEPATSGVWHRERALGH